jgi:hypothetical protein
MATNGGPQIEMSLTLQLFRADRSAFHIPILDPIFNEHSAAKACAETGELPNWTGYCSAAARAASIRHRGSGN